MNGTDEHSRDSESRVIEPAESGLAPEPESTTSGPREKDSDRSFGRWLVETVVLVIVAFALAQGVRAYAVQPFEVDRNVVYYALHHLTPANLE
jgi:hypothetical protein